MRRRRKGRRQAKPEQEKKRRLHWEKAQHILWYDHMHPHIQHVHTPALSWICWKRSCLGLPQAWVFSELLRRYWWGDRINKCSFTSVTLDYLYHRRPEVCLKIHILDSTADLLSQTLEWGIFSAQSEEAQHLAATGPSSWAWSHCRPPGHSARAGAVGPILPKVSFKNL